MRHFIRLEGQMLGDNVFFLFVVRKKSIWKQNRKIFLFVCLWSRMDGWIYGFVPVNNIRIFAIIINEQEVRKKQDDKFEFLMNDCCCCCWMNSAHIWPFVYLRLEEMWKQDNDQFNMNDAIEHTNDLTKLIIILIVIWMCSMEMYVFINIRISRE